MQPVLKVCADCGCTFVTVSESNLCPNCTKKAAGERPVEENEEEDEED